MLTELQVKNAKSTGKRYMILDSDGLYLDITTNGVKSWRYRYKIEGRERKDTLGRYPLVSLKEARERRDAIKKQIMDGIDPKMVRRARVDANTAPTFAEVYSEWFEKQVVPVRSPERVNHIESWGRLYILPFLGDVPIDQVDAIKLLELLRMLEAKKIVYTAHSIRGVCGQVFRFAIATGRATRDPSADLKGALQPRRSQHRATTTAPKEIGALLRAIDVYPGYVVRCAMQLQALTFVRPGELRHAEWKEIDLPKAEWRIPKEKMKMKRPHIVPLSRQSVAVLESLFPITGHGVYVFPSARSPQGVRPMSEVAVLAALRTMGFEKDQMSGHGFRSMASTRLYESGLWPGDAIERQLAHVEGNTVKAAYNYADHLRVRREMMQWWADYLDELRG